MKRLQLFGNIMMLSSLISLEALADSNIDTTDKYAWSENSGWVNFNDANGGVTVYDDHLEGYAWTENIGWIRLGTHTSGGAHTYANTSENDYGVNHDGSGNLSGYAWSETAGWINFNPSHSQVTIDATTGDFDGYAWAEKVGWIHFQNANPAYKVKQLFSNNEDSFTISKTNSNRGTVKARLKDEITWDITCGPACQQNSHNYAPGSEVTVRAYPAKGFVFSSWSGDCSGTETKTSVIIGDAAKTCTAQFDLDPNEDMYSLTINQVGGNGTTVKSAWPPIYCSAANCIAYRQPGKTIKLTAQYNDSNTVFKEWTGDCSGTSSTTSITMNTDKTCTATFQTYNPDDVFSLTVDKIGNGQGNVTGKLSGENNTIKCKTDCQQASYDYPAASKVILYAAPATGFVFGGWSGDQCSGDKKRITVLMDAAKNCTAQFDLDPNLVWHQLSVTTVGTGNGIITEGSLIDCGNLCSAHYQEDKTVKLTATPSLFSQLVGWSGDCIGTNAKVSAKVTMTADMTCTANFQSLFEIAAIDMVEMFNATTVLENDEPFSQKFPSSEENNTRLKEAFWLNMPTLMQTDQHLVVSAAQNWPNQFNDTEWLPSDPIAEYTQSIQIKTNEYIGIRATLINNESVEEEVGIVIYYGDELPEVDADGWNVVVGFFSRWALPIWW